MVENVVAFMVSTLLSLFGVTNELYYARIYVPQLNMWFVITRECTGIHVSLLMTFIYVLTTWAYLTITNHNLKIRKCITAALMGFPIFFFANIFRIFMQILLLCTVLNDIYGDIMIIWNLYELSVGMTVLLITFVVLTVSTWIYLRRK